MLKLIVKLGESFGAEKLIEIVSSHTVLNIGLSFVEAASSVLHEIAEASLKVKVRTTADPILDNDYSKEMGPVHSLFKLHDKIMDDLGKIGVQGYTCTPYFIDNRPNFGDHCAWSESSAVIYLNSVIGGRSNREGGLVDIACAILGKTSYHGLHITENRRGQVLIKIPQGKWNTYDYTSMGLKLGEIAGSNIPVIEGLEGISEDDIKNLGSASASTGALGLIHIIGVTPEALTFEDAFQNGKPDETIEIEPKDLVEVREKYSIDWNQPPRNIAIGCPHLSKTEVINVIEKLKGKIILEDVNFWIYTNSDTKKYILNSEYNRILENSGAKLSSSCPTYVPPQKPITTNSAKSCFYSPATYRNIDYCIKLATEGRENE